MKDLTEDEFDAKFTAVPDAAGDTIRPDETGLDLAATNLWTIVENDGELTALSGVHKVNRLGFLITQEHWTEPTAGVWMAAREDDDDEEAGDEG